MRCSCYHSNYKRGIDEDELSWTSHHFCLWLQQWHSLVHSMSPLSSTGIGLNHVPDGDEDFSNAIHQLWMRRYDIFLAQPFKVSPALAAAAMNVSQWTGLAAGGSPQ